MAATSSGSSRSDKGVKPTRSAKRTVTTRRSIEPGALLAPVRPAGRLWPSALEDRAGLLRVVDHEGEHRPVAPATEEEVAVDVHAGVGQSARDAGHAPRAVVHLGQDRLALAEGVAALRLPGPRGGSGWRDSSGPPCAGNRCTAPPRAARRGAPRPWGRRTTGSARTCPPRAAPARHPPGPSGALRGRAGRGDAAGRGHGWPRPPAGRRGAAPAGPAPPPPPPRRA